MVEVKAQHSLQAMATIPYTETVLAVAFVCSFFLLHWIRQRNSPIINWPAFGMLPGVLWNLPRIHEYTTNLLQQCGGTLDFRGPWFCNVDFVLTSDPMNTHHILSKNFPNYTKGPDFTKNFEFLGGGIINAESDSWKLQRKMIHSYLKHPKFHLFLEKTIREKTVQSLFPVLDHACVSGMELNMEDVLGRLGFDISCMVFLGSDTKCLSLDFPEVAYERAFNEIEEAVLSRHVLPEKVWRLLKWLQVGQERKHSASLKIIDDFIHRCVSLKREERSRSGANMVGNETGFDFLTAYLAQEEATVTKRSHKFLSDLVMNLVVGGRDTSSAALSWFFWLLATHPATERRLVQEIKDGLGQRSSISSVAELNKLVYLHAALLETLRLYPSVPIDHKGSVRPDTLPSGLHIKENTKIFISFYAMGRMEEIWGKNCYEFRPERWISKDGRIVHEPSYKFTAFGAGPRTCLGKDMSLVQMKMVATAIIFNYRFQLVEDRPVLPCASVVLHMKHGFKVRVTKRST